MSSPPTISEALAFALRYHQAGRLQEAEQIYRQILAVEPNQAQAWHRLGVVAQQVGRHELALEYIARALTLRPDYAEAQSDLGNSFKEQLRLDASIACYRRALELNPGLVEARYNLGNVLQQQGQLDEAIVQYREALSHRPNYAEAYNNLGNALFEQRKLDEAVACYRRALELKPDFAEAHVNLGNALKCQGKLDEAFAYYGRAVELRADYADAHLCQSYVMLLRGDFERGWPEHEWRWKTIYQPAREFPQPLWDGTSLHGQMILLHAEQGLGDTVQFVRYVPLVKERGARVILACQTPLIGLLASCPGVDCLVGEGVIQASFDVHAPLLSLPRIFKTTVDTIPANVPYLKADAALVAQWREKLTAINGLRIGINWQGRGGRGDYRQRDIPLECFASLAQVPGVRLISLQKGPRVGAADQGVATFELAGEGQPGILDLGDIDQTRGAFMDTAAIMMNLDLVITSDTSTPHLAGALGVPVWVALPFAPDWRWLLDRSDSPWYPTMRLFRQKSPGDWKSVFEEIEAALRRRLGA
jgi:tetratricopeptide (TPR) repeat protein